ncbi:di-trans,poly-cis-decaprenylcistransferas-like protein [Westerdykella ornata]|uniref:ditrans,polycis-polyprenyl diphosphate synthase [(2E,6E)-farnesyldiphosphate specific] n=1 Tax=Westerdykella ornata TaxID=318751 RepID=A0A6A6JNV3_WESOR|nr:di-trans,poly-cis-decaprenylcistransferas-like protein [Westerdykella ornata]KAF2278202.1 di-trans,poly-cis-decaprenylcistransferas-like protein [Westerdykella ornata]
MASTGISPREAAVLRRGKLDGKPLSAEEREKLLKPYLPEDLPPSTSPSRGASPTRRPKNRRASTSRRRRPGLIRHGLHVLIYAIISFLFSVFFRFRHAFRHVRNKIVALLKYHHRTPEFIQRDTRHLERLPKHLSVILQFYEGDEDQGSAGLEGLVNDVGEIAAWTAAAGIPFLSVYERTGKLKNYIQQTHTSISSTLEAYFGPRRTPTLSVRAPHLQSYSPPPTPDPQDDTSPTSNGHPSPKTSPKPPRQHLTVLLLSAEDGRDTLVDLTKTLSEMAQNGALQPEQIDAKLIDSELCEAVSGEPDLLVLFQPSVCLKGYPPWQLRLTEIFHLPDNKGVNYQVFLRALHAYAKMEMRLGR